MAALVWSGTGTWDNSNTANWTPAQVPVAGDTITLAASSSGTMTIGTSASGGTLNLTNAVAGFTIAFGTNKISLSGSGAATVFTGNTAVAITGTPLIEVSWSTGTVTWDAKAVSEANSISVSFLTGSDSITATGSIRNFTITSGSTRSMADATTTFFGNVSIASTASWSSGSSTRTMAATSGTKTITSNGLTLDSPWTFAGVGGTFQLVDAFTTGSSRTVTLTNGTLNLNNNNLTAGAFASNNSNTRTLTSGTGQIYLTGTGSVWNTATSTGLTLTTRPVVNITTNTASARSVTTNSVGPTSGSLVDFNITAGTGTFGTSGGSMGKMNFTGFAGSLLTTSAGYWCDNVTMASGMTVPDTATQMTLYSQSASPGMTFNTNGITFNKPIQIYANTSTFKVTLSSALNMGARALTLTNCVFDSAGYAVTMNNFASTGSITRSIVFGASVWTITGSGATAWSVTGTNFSTTVGTGKITMSSASAKTFAGGGFTYPTIENSGAGALTISGANTFSDIRSTVTAPTFIFPSGATTTLLAWSLAGTAGNLVNISASTPGTVATISKSSGTVSANYLSLTDNRATGGATWKTNFSVKGANTSGWSFPSLDFFFTFSRLAY